MEWRIVRRRDCLKLWQNIITLKISKHTVIDIVYRPVTNTNVVSIVKKRRRAVFRDNAAARAVVWCYCLSVCLSVCLSLCLSVYLSVCLSVCVSRVVIVVFSKRLTDIVASVVSCCASVCLCVSRVVIVVFNKRLTDIVASVVSCCASMKVFSRRLNPLSFICRRLNKLNSVGLLTLAHSLRSSLHFTSPLTSGHCSTRHTEDVRYNH